MITLETTQKAAGIEVTHKGENIAFIRYVDNQWGKWFIEYENAFCHAHWFNDMQAAEYAVLAGRMEQLTRSR